MPQTFSYWEQTSFINNSDVIIIGSGLVGLSAALHLKQKQPALKVLVLERGFMPTGASTKNAGFACFGTISEQIANIKASSEDEAIRLVDYRWRGLQRLRENLGDANIDYQQHGGYELFMADEASRAEECIEQITYFNKLVGSAIGQKDIYSIADAKIADFGFQGVSHLIYNRCEGQIDTGKMMRTLLQRVNELGVIVVNNCEIERIESTFFGVELTTSQGSFKTGKAIVATNAFASQLFPQLDVTPGRGQVLVTKPVNGLKLQGTYHFDEGYYYFRNINGRVLFGGGRNIDFISEQTWDFGYTEIVKEKLLDYLNKVILRGANAEVDYWWSGIMGFGNELNPIIKQVQPNVFCAVRCNGMGVAMGSLVGEEVAELLFESF
ncbi:FAD-binding oxidoreductase [Mucilaginibacter limnophilus]|uniref:FAD-binding oxidoreductase n=1 Tax=Mucilaginibacter limnophilus TaxID=1932778 RepID=A0A437MUY0_9SPHI|nr:FAD-dependent oxidoreductase [Mucilaginibacter limnophilus]RVU01458.1 FAD-binding oxidoreductase [Mucilaginibacter limnophilus]